MTVDLVVRVGALSLAALLFVLMAVIWAKSKPGQEVGCPFLIFGALALTLVVVGTR